MKISIFGLGYVGCVSLGCLAKEGNTLIGVDVNEHKVDLINHSKPTIIEKDIDEIINMEFKRGRIQAKTNGKEAVLSTDVSIICVGTPNNENGQLNLKYVFNVAKEIGIALKKKDGFHTVAIRSTVSPGTNDKVCEIIEYNSGKKRNKDFGVVSNPEFLREGSAVYDFYNPPVTVLASESVEAINIMKEIYRNINAPTEIVDIKVAEIIKYVNNSFHALKISFANEIGNICKTLDIDSHSLMELFCKDKKLNLSSYYLKPGYAYGGSCLPKDLKALTTIAHDNYLESSVLDSIEKSNENQKKLAIKLIESKGKKKIGILGISFKPGTDDLRLSPTVELVEYFIGKGYEVNIYDRAVYHSKIVGINKRYIEQHIPHLSELITNRLETVIERSDIVVITYLDKEFFDLPKEYPDKLFIDLARVVKDLDYTNYDGICW